MTQWLRVAWSRLRAVASRRRLDREFDAELVTHLELLTEELRRRGLSTADARREALRKLGQPAALRDVHRDERGLPLADALGRDLRHAVRNARRSPVFTAVVSLSLAVGIGATTALFSLVDSLMLRSLPVAGADRLFQIQVVPVVAGAPRKARIAFDPQAFEAVRTRREVFSGVVGFTRLERPLVEVAGRSDPSREVEQVSVNYFRELGVTPVAGRMPDDADADIAVISARLWRTRFDGRQQAIGQMLLVDSRPYAIVGVAPPRFHGFTLDSSADIWISSRSGSPDLMMVARLTSGTSVVRARHAVESLLRDQFLERFRSFPPDQAVDTELLPAGRGLSRLRGQYGSALAALMALVTIVLLATCSNVGNLLVLRSAARGRELTVRAALGASRSRLVFQYVVESLFIAAIGCAAGVALAAWGVVAVLGLLPIAAVPDSLAFRADPRMLGFAVGISVLAAALFGLAPAWRATEVDLTGPLRSSQGTTSPRRIRRLGRGLVACQVGLSVVLLVGAGLFVQTLRNLARVDVGFPVSGLVQVQIDTRFAGSSQSPASQGASQAGGAGPVAGVFRLLRERLATLPGVTAVTGVRNPLMQRSWAVMSVSLPGLERQPDVTWDTAQVGPDFFETMGIPAIHGRVFAASDFEHTGERFVVNETFARSFYPGDDILRRAPSIVGIVRDTRLFDVRSEVRPVMYQMLAREPDRISSLQVRVDGDAAAALPAIRKAVVDVNPRLLVGIRTMQDELDRDISRERMVASTSVLFGALGLVLASIGIFGVASFAVADRTKELAIRRALGAGRWPVVRASLGETMVVFGVGLAGGALAATAVVRVAAVTISDLVFGLTATDTGYVAAALVVLVTVAAAACVVPAMRAASIDPLHGIRDG